MSSQREISFTVKLTLPEWGKMLSVYVASTSSESAFLKVLRCTSSMEHLIFPVKVICVKPFNACINFLSQLLKHPELSKDRSSYGIFQWSQPYEVKFTTMEN
jgi:hypothetical protein